MSRRKQEEYKVKKILSSILIVFLLLFLTTCDRKPKKPDMYIEVAQLSEQEKNIAKLLGYDNGQVICDYMLDDTVNSIQVNSYELIDGEWDLISGGGYAFSDEAGRFALKFDDIPRGYRFSIQSENSTGSMEHTSPELKEDYGAMEQESVNDTESMGRTTSLMSELTEITYEEEIPLAIQISTSKDSIISYFIESFFTSEEYEKHDYEHVYAITIRFSQKTLDVLDNVE